MRFPIDWRLAAVSAALALTAAAGCGGGSREVVDAPAPVKPGPISDETGDAVAPNEVETPTPSADEPSGENSGGDEVPNSAEAAVQEASAPSVASGDAEEAEAPAPRELPPDAVQRLLLLTPDGPLVLEAGVFIDGKPFRQAMAAVVAEVLAAADVDGDGRATWDEATQDSRFIYGGYGNAEINNEQERQNALRLYDVDQDGIVDPEEVPRFVTRNSGGAQPFAMRSGDLYAAPGEANDPAWQAIDQDEDGVLSSEEVAAAGATLAMRDADADGVIVPSDLAELALEGAFGMPAMRQPRYRGFGPKAVLRLGELADWTLIGYGLEEAYPAFPGMDPGEVYRTAPRLFEQLDQNSDLRLDPDEVARLDELEPHLQIEVQLGAETPADEPPIDADKVGDESSSETANAEDESAKEAPAISTPVPLERLVLTFVSEELSPTTQVALRRGVVSIRVADFSIELFVNDAASDVDPAAEAAATIAQFDGDGNGYLDDSELVDGAVGPFAGLDANGDGQVVAEEIARYTTRRRTALFSQVRVEAGSRQGTLFSDLDSNGDGCLGARELASAAQKLVRRDANGDGRIESHEAAAGYSVAIARGDPQQQVDLFVRRPATPDHQPSPRWFRGMDANSDGDVSAREFPGGAELFARLDLDSDGLLSVDEAKQADAASRHEPSN